MTDRVHCGSSHHNCCVLHDSTWPRMPRHSALGQAQHGLRMWIHFASLGRNSLKFEHRKWCLTMKSGDSLCVTMDRIGIWPEELGKWLSDHSTTMKSHSITISLHLKCLQDQNLWWNRSQTLQFSWCWHRKSVGRRREKQKTDTWDCHRDVSIYHWGGQTKLIDPQHDLKPNIQILARAFTNRGWQ